MKLLNIAQLEDDYKILPPTPNGMNYRYGHFVPKFTVDSHPEFATYHGFKDEANRQNVASNFLKPFNWKEYCTEIVTEDVCASGNDTVAKRLPATEEEEGLYFLLGEFIGHFNVTNDSDCTNNPECFGHLINNECNARAFSEAQMFWNDISMKSMGPLEPNGGYTDDQMVNIFEAANWTRSNVLFVWSLPSLLVSNFEDTDASWFRVQFPDPTEACQQKQLSDDLSCTDNELDRVGNSLHFCDYPVERTVKIISSELKKIHDATSLASKSPALDFLQTFRIKLHTMQEIMDETVRLSHKLQDFDLDSTYPDREATCRWIYDNLEQIELELLPIGYPRKIVQQVGTMNQGLSKVAVSFAGLSLCTILCVSILIVTNRSKSAIRQAQVAFLVWMLIGKVLTCLDSYAPSIFRLMLSLLFCQTLGLSLVSLGAICLLITSLNITCTLFEWAILLGYTMVTCPLLIKISAINKVAISAQKLRRVNFDGTKLKRYPLYFCIPVLLFLIVWTIVDIPKPTTSLSVHVESGNVFDQILVNSHCASSLQVWSIVAYTWQMVLVFSALVLVCRSGHISTELSENQSLMFITYSQFVSVILRITLEVLIRNDILQVSSLSPSVCIVLSVDVLFETLIYMSPKIHAAYTEEREHGGRRRLSSIKSSTSSKGFAASVSQSLMMSQASTNTNGSMRTQLEKMIGGNISALEDNTVKTGKSIGNLKLLRKTGVSVIKKRQMDPDAAAEEEKEPINRH